VASGIYQITCSANGKVYIGSAVALSRRKAQHFNRLRSGNHHNTHLQNAWNKYGESAFQFSVLSECTIEELERLEESAISAVPRSMLFNVRLTVETNRGAKWSADSRKRIAGRKFSPLAHKRRAEVGVTSRQREAYKTRRHHKGRGRSRGFHHSEETRRKIAKAQPKKRRALTPSERLAAVAVLEKYWRCPQRIARGAANRRYGNRAGQLHLFSKDEGDN
jgi:group I intron endonuclease